MWPSLALGQLATSAGLRDQLGGLLLVAAIGLFRSSRARRPAGQANADPMVHRVGTAMAHSLDMGEGLRKSENQRSQLLDRQLPATLVEVGKHIGTPTSSAIAQTGSDAGVGASLRFAERMTPTLTGSNRNGGHRIPSTRVNATIPST